MGVKVKYKNGAWWLFINHHGKRRAKKIGDKDAALSAASKVRAALAAGDLRLTTDDGETFEKFALRWLKDGKANRKASTQRFYTFNVKNHLVPIIGTRPVATITRSHCRMVITECQTKGLKRASIQAVQRTLSAILSQAVEDDLIASNVAFRMGKHMRKGDEPRRQIDPLTREEAQTFLGVVKDHWPEYYAFFLCALRTGMRLGELLALQWGDVDLQGKFINVQHNLVSGKLTTPKSHKRRRVDMSMHLVETFEKRLVQAKAEMLKAGKGELNPWVFTNRDGEPLDGDNVRKRVVGPMLTKAKLRHIRVHDLRHTYASLLIQQNESLKYISEQLGHSSIKLTVDTYGHLVPGANRAAVDKLDDAPIRNPGATGNETATAEDGRK